MLGFLASKLKQLFFMYNIHLGTSVLIVDSDTLMGFFVSFVLFRICNQIQARFVLFCFSNQIQARVSFVLFLQQDSSTFLFCLHVHLLLCPSTVNIFCERGFPPHLFCCFCAHYIDIILDANFVDMIFFQLHTDVITLNGDVVGAAILQDEGVQSERVNQPHVLEL